MQLRYSYPVDADHLEAELLRAGEWFRQHGVESVTNLVIECYPWRNGKRLQAVNGRGEVRPVPILPEPDAPRCGSLGPERREELTIRERPDDRGDTGLASAFNHDD